MRKVGSRSISVRFAVAILSMLTWLCSGSDALSQPTRVDVQIVVFSCALDASDPPELRIWTLHFPDEPGVPVTPHWRLDGNSWQTTVSVPAGHYVVYALSKQCDGHGVQWVAVPGQLRHLTVTLNERGKKVWVDENMYAGAIYGELAAVPARVEIMSADSLIGEQTRSAADIDGNVYQINHLRPGHYILRVEFGNVVASRRVTVGGNTPGDVWPVVQADLTPAEAAEIVRAEAAGAGFVTVRYNGFARHNGTGPLETFSLGAATIDGWTTRPLLPPSDYDTTEQRISAPALAALAGAQQFLATDNRIQGSFKNLSAWSAQIESFRPSGGVLRIRIDLFSIDSAAWQKVAPQTQGVCPPDIDRGDILLVFEAATLRLLASAVCR